MTHCVVAVKLEVKMGSVGTPEQMVRNTLKHGMDVVARLKSPDNCHYDVDRKQAAVNEYGASFNLDRNGPIIR